MRDEDDRLATLAGERGQQVDDLVPRRRVEVPSRLVGEDDARLVRQRSSDRDALLLAARELAGQMAARPARPTAASSDSTRARRSRAPVCAGERDLDVLRRGQRRDQVELLEDEAECAEAEAAERAVAERGEVTALEETAPSVAPVEPAEQLQQRRLPDPLGPTSATNSPSPITRSTSRTACT